MARKKRTNWLTVFVAVVILASISAVAVLYFRSVEETGTKGLSANDEKVIEELYSYDVFVFNSKDAKETYSAVLTKEENSTRTYNVTDLGEGVSATSYLFSTSEGRQHFFDNDKILMQNRILPGEFVRVIEEVNNETVTFQGKEYSARITDQGEICTLEISKEVI